MVQVSKAKAERAKKSSTVKVSKKLQQSPKKKAAPKPPEVAAPPVVKTPQVADDTIKKVTDVMASSVQETAKNAQMQADSVNQLVQALEQQMNENRLLKQAQPVRLKVHRDKNKLIEYIDVVPVEAKITKH